MQHGAYFLLLQHCWANGGSIPIEPEERAVIARMTLSEWKKIAATAASYGVTVCPHWFHDLHAHLVAATANARYVEFFPDDQVLNFRRLIDRQLKVERGMLILHSTPGLGFGFDERAVSRYALKDGSTAWKVLK